MINRFFHLSLLLPTLLLGFAEEATKPVAPADQAWAEIEKLKIAPAPPASWNQKAPTKEEHDAFKAELLKAAEKAAAKSKEFHTTYPTHPKAQDARNTEALFEKRIAALKQPSENGSKQKDPGSEAFQRRHSEMVEAAKQKQPEGMDAVLAQLEQGARDLIKDFPEREEGYSYLLMVASKSTADKGLLIARELAASNAPDQIKSHAKRMFKQHESLGKPLTMAFTAVDGTAVDMAKMKGKVVLIDFWATWCGPCVAELPKVKKAYAELHRKGFEIIGISLDEDKAALLKFIKSEQMPWAQFFDGNGWKNSIAQEYGIHSIPAMWLVDKQGVVRDINARDDLVGKVQKLLAEK
ncbi:MAG: TlpA disulfide reductase family protein [Verrucomicrobiota bacterium]|nr:TlpA disulfide reductase family protein [Verrucomicrobiota bacterium]